MKRRKPANDGPAAPEQDSPVTRSGKRLKRDAGVMSTGMSKKRLFSLSFMLLLISLMLRYAQHMLMTDKLTVPFGDPLPILYNASHWGSLRPGSYFGMQSATSKSLATGLMWFRNQIEPGQNLLIRHWCSQHDSIDKYGWNKHDFDSFGIQQIIDKDLSIKTSFLIHGPDHWSAKISASTSSNGSVPVSLIYYAATSSDGDELRIKSKEPFVLTGRTADLPDGFTLTVTVDGDPEDILFQSHTGIVSNPPLVYLKENLMQHLVLIRSEDERADGLIVLREDIPHRPNFIAHQILFENEVSLIIDFTSGDKRSPEIDYDTELSSREHRFSTQFEDKFHLKAKGFSANEISFAESAASNLIGGTGFFSGSMKVTSEKSGSEFLPYGPFDLLTSVPSRSFFPRGFLWDEGFLDLLTLRLNPGLSKQILRSWLSLMNSGGWIPREVILGPEAEARVPAEFVIQRNFNANPPTLFLAIESMMERNLLTAYELRELFPRLELWYKWFAVSQAGEMDWTYRWRGRNASALNELNPKTLASGLDDYPRASHPTDSEYHIDLRCWIAVASRVMEEIAKKISSPADVYSETASRLSDNKLMDDLHWSSEHGMYCDQGMHSRKVKLVKKELPNGQHFFERATMAGPVFGCVYEFGYVSLFPLLMQLLEPDNPHLGTVLDKMESELLTPYGLRSLSNKSFYYNKRNTEHDPPYWRSAVWINMNYLAVKSLKHYASTEGPYVEKAKSLYDKLRKSVISNMYREYVRTGYIWEQYDDVTGKGKGSHPFTGWSALVVLLMSEDY